MRLLFRCKLVKAVIVESWLGRELDILLLFICKVVKAVIVDSWDGIEPTMRLLVRLNTLRLTQVESCDGIEPPKPPPEFELVISNVVNFVNTDN